MPRPRWSRTQSGNTECSGAARGAERRQPTYRGDLGHTRYSALHPIDTSNVKSLRREKIAVYAMTH